MNCTSIESEEEAPPPKKAPVKAKAAPAKKEESSEEEDDDEEDGKHSFMGSMSSWDYPDVKHLQGGFKINVCWVGVYHVSVYKLTLHFLAYTG